MAAFGLPLFKCHYVCFDNPNYMSLVLLGLQYIYLILDQWLVLGHHMYEHFIILIVSGNYYLITDLHPLFINFSYLLLYLNTYSLNISGRLGMSSCCQIDLTD